MYKTKLQNDYKFELQHDFVTATSSEVYDFEDFDNDEEFISYQSKYNNQDDDLPNLIKLTNYNSDDDDDDDDNDVYDDNDSVCENTNDNEIDDDIDEDTSSTYMSEPESDNEEYENEFDVDINDVDKKQKCYLKENQQYWNQSFFVAFRIFFKNQYSEGTSTIISKNIYINCVI